jgi:hypothetical protein
MLNLTADYSHKKFAKVLVISESFYFVNGQEYVLQQPILLTLSKWTKIDL